MDWVQGAFALIGAIIGTLIGKVRFGKIRIRPHLVTIKEGYQTYYNSSDQEHGDGKYFSLVRIEFSIDVHSTKEHRTTISNTRLFFKARENGSKEARTYELRQHDSKKSNQMSTDYRSMFKLQPHDSKHIDLMTEYMLNESDAKYLRRDDLRCYFLCDVKGKKRKKRKIAFRHFGLVDL